MERASAQENREADRQFRLLRADGPEGASRKGREAERVQTQEADDVSWRNPAESQGRQTSIKKDGSRRPVTGDQAQRAEEPDEVGKA